MRVRSHKSYSALFVFTFLIGSMLAQAEESKAPLSTCNAGPELKGKAKQRFDSVALMTIAGNLEAQGESDFHLKYSVPARECLVESFAVSDSTIVATYNALEKGDSTLNYRFRIDRPTDDSEVLVLYSGMAGLVSGGGYVVHLSEERQGVISWYAMFKDEPPYPAIKELVTEIANGTASPLMSVRWPTGAKEGEIVAYDSKKLK